jgi:hypothetical protein
MDGYEYLAGIDVQAEIRTEINRIKSDYKSELIDKLINGFRGSFTYDAKIGNSILVHLTEDDFIKTDELQNAIRQALQSVPSTGEKIVIEVVDTEYADVFKIYINTPSKTIEKSRYWRQKHYNEHKTEINYKRKLKEYEESQNNKKAK